MKKMCIRNVVFLCGLGFIISCNNPSLADYSINEKENQVEKKLLYKRCKK